ncbi:hypothetical protein NUU61_004678 [Penicillium alfredii]|uniref:Uncharacterized protein n=1 Tax=Penicillium alfredii TaxID=1506179 RepID=A0A9W9F825_9EURO|nr:uncharacterized protein NUU61_004678 [Penicillium alfredii]KAJ5095322.1 hypothetical protein NUU61_004678 [Penicillium alfredii]
MCISLFALVPDIKTIRFFDTRDALFPPSSVQIDEACKSEHHHPSHAASLSTKNPDFHSTLAISASYIDFSRRKSTKFTKTLHHISQAYSLVKIELPGPFSVYDSAIAAMVSLVIYQQAYHQHTTGPT